MPDHYLFVTTVPIVKFYLLTICCIFIHARYFNDCIVLFLLVRTTVMAHVAGPELSLWEFAWTGGIFRDASRWRKTRFVYVGSYRTGDDRIDYKCKLSDPR